MAIMRALMLMLMLVASCVHAQALPDMPPGAVLVLSYHDVVPAAHPADDIHAVTTAQLAAHLAWLKHHGYRPVGLDDLVRARAGGMPLPPRAVLLTFDDGYASFHSQVLPLLKLHRFPAVLALVGAWLEVPAGSSVRYGDELVPRERFLSWGQLKEIVASGLVEIASHTHSLHEGVLANREGNTQPAATTRIYDPDADRHEDDARYAARIKSDLARNNTLLAARLGVRPRAIAWPYGAYNRTAQAIATALGMPIQFTLQNGVASAGEPLAEIRRNLIEKNPGVQDLLWGLHAVRTPGARRVVHVSMADVGGDEAGLSRLLDRIARLKVNTAVLHVGTADPRHVGRTSWQLATRAGVRVFAAFDREASAERYAEVARLAPFAGLAFDGEARADALEAALVHRAPLETMASIPAARADELASLLARHDLVEVVLDGAHARTAIERFVAAAGSEVKRTVLSLGLGARPASDAIARRLRAIQLAGGVSFGYRSDRPVEGYPAIEQVRPVLSLASQPE